MNKLIQLTNHPLFGGNYKNRGFRVYKQEIDRRLGIPGLTQLVKKVTGHEPKLDETYAFVVRKQDTVKILTKNPNGCNLLQLFDEEAKTLKEEFKELTLL